MPLHNHDSPCPSLESTAEAVKGLEEDMKAHERELGGIAANLGQLLEGQKKLFDRTDELCRTAERNRLTIDKIDRDQGSLKEQIGNGLKDDIAAQVCEKLKKLFASHTREAEYGHRAGAKPISNGDEPPPIRSFTDFLNYGWWQLIHKNAWVFPAMIIFFVLWWVLWGGSKWGIFGEPPFPKTPPPQVQTTKPPATPTK